MNSTPSVFGVDPLRAPSSLEDAEAMQREIDARTIRQSMEAVRKKLEEDFKTGRASQTEVMQLFIASDIQEELINTYKRDLKHKRSGAARGSLSISAMEALSPQEAVLVALAHAPTYLLKEHGQSTPHVTIHQLGSHLGKKVDMEVRLKELEALPASNRDFQRLQKNHDQASRSAAYRSEINRKFLQEHETQGLAEQDVQLMGNYLRELLTEVGLLERYRAKLPRSKHVRNCVRVPDVHLEAFVALGQRLARKRPTHRPRLVPPFHIDGASSIYTTNTTYCSLRFMQSKMKGCGDRSQMAASAPEFFGGVSAIQASALRVNRRVLDTIRNGVRHGQRGYVDLYLAAPVDPRHSFKRLPDNLPEDVFQQTINERRRQVIAFRGYKQKYLRRRQVLQTAEEYSLQDRFYIPRFYDARGRIYERCDLGADAGDLGRGLLEFADAAPIGKEGIEYLSVHLSAVFGDDKLPWSERAQWAQRNQTMLLAIAQDPHANRQWEDAPEPFQALAGAFEWQGVVEEGEAFQTRCLVTLDATSSGLQIMAGIRGDADIAQDVNLRPGMRRDQYLKVAKKALDFVQQVASGILTGTPYNDFKANNESVEDRAAFVTQRKRDVVLAAQQLRKALDECPKSLRTLAKPVVMTLSYGATQYSLKKTTAENIIENGLMDYTQAQLAGDVFAEGMWRAAQSILGSAFDVMNFLSEAACVMAKNQRPFVYQGPNGFIMRLQYWKKSRSRKLTVRSNGIQVPVRMNLAVGFSDELDVRNYRAKTPPNFVHQLDSCLITSAAYWFTEETQGAPLATIHDCVATRACDMPIMAKALREVYVDMFADTHILQDLHDQLSEALGGTADQLPPVPPKLGWDAREVLESTYFFS